MIRDRWGICHCYGVRLFIISPCCLLLFMGLLDSFCIFNGDVTNDVKCTSINDKQDTMPIDHHYIKLTYRTSIFNYITCSFACFTWESSSMRFHYSIIVHHVPPKSLPLITNESLCLILICICWIKECCLTDVVLCQHVALLTYPALRPVVLVWMATMFQITKKLFGLALFSCPGWWWVSKYFLAGCMTYDETYWCWASRFY